MTMAAKVTTTCVDYALNQFHTRSNTWETCPMCVKNYQYVLLALPTIETV